METVTERAAHAARVERFLQQAQRGWDQGVEAEVHDLVCRLLGGENINLGLNTPLGDRIKHELAESAKTGLVCYGNTPDMIKYCGQVIEDDRVLRLDQDNTAPLTGMQELEMLAAVDVDRQAAGRFETPRLSVTKITKHIGIPADPPNLERLQTVLYLGEQKGSFVCDRDSRWMKHPEREPAGQSATLAPAAQGHEELMDRHRRILQAMLELRAVSEASRRTQDDIAERAEGVTTPNATFKAKVAELRRRQFVATKEGRGGGCWLTELGRTVADEVIRQ